MIFNTAATAISGALVGGIIGMVSGDKNGALKGAIVGAGIGLIGSFNMNGLKIGAKVSVAVALQFTENIQINQQQTQLEKNVRNVIKNEGVTKESMYKMYRMIINGFPQVNPQKLQENRHWYLGGIYLSSASGFLTSAEQQLIKPNQDNQTVFPTTSMNPNTFWGFYEGCMSWGLLVRMVAHEFGHIYLYWGLYSNFGRMSYHGYSGTAQEVICNYIMIQDNGLPKLTDDEKFIYASGGYDFYNQLNSQYQAWLINVANSLQRTMKSLWPKISKVLKNSMIEKNKIPK